MQHLLNLGSCVGPCLTGLNSEPNNWTATKSEWRSYETGNHFTVVDRTGNDQLATSQPLHAILCNNWSDKFELWNLIIGIAVKSQQLS